MTNEKLDQLFQSARSIEPETSAKEIAEWITKAAVAATITGGVAVGYKLLLTKKMIVMIMSTLSLLGITVVSVGFFNSTTDEFEKSVGGLELTKYEITNTTAAVVNEIKATEIILAEITNNLGINNKGAAVEKMPSQSTSKLSSQLSLDNNGLKSYLPPVEILGKKKDTLSVAEIEREIQIKPFTELRVDGVFDLIIDQGETEKLVYVSKNGDEIIAENEGNILVLSSGEFGNEKSRCQENTIVRLTVKNITRMELSGIGSVLVNNVKLDNLEVIATGLGDVEMVCTLNKLVIDASGIGNINLSGAAQYAMLNYSGVGDLDAKNLLVDDLVLNTSGIGDNHVYAKKTISIEGTGVGDIRYSGGAAVTSMSFSGIGTINSQE